MAFKFSVAAAGASNVATSNTLVVSGGSIALGDLLLLFTCYEVGGLTTFTDPSGWTAGGSLSPTMPNVETTNGGDQMMHVAVKIAAAGDVGTPTYVTTDVGAFGGRWNQQLRVYSGRVSTSVAAAFSNTSHTAQGVSGATPYTYAITGITALASDDIVVFTGVDVVSSSGGTWTAPISGYANTLIVNTPAKAAPCIALDNVNASAGATGTLSQLLTDSGGASTIVPVGYVFSLPQATAATVPAPMYHRKNVLYFI